MSVISIVLALAWPGAAWSTSPARAESPDLVVTVSVAFVIWLSRFASRFHAERRLTRQAKVVPFPGPGAE